MRTLLRSTAICLLAGLFIVSACKKKKDPVTSDGTSNSNNSSFDRKAMLTNLANNIIVPAYQSFNKAVVKLDSTVAAFTASPDAAKLAALQASFKNAYIAWQSCAEFQFGPASQQYLRENLNTFPANTEQMNSNISSGSYNLAAIINFAAKGFPGMDYLLFGTGADNTAILAQYTSDSKAANRVKYLAALSADIKTNTTAVLNSWQSDYTSTFINASGTDIGSSIGQLVNSIDMGLDIIKNNKLGIPLGKQSMGTLYPEKTEAYYCGISSQLLQQELKSIEAIYLGKSAQGDGLGFDDYLAAINAQYTSGTLNDAIKNALTTANTDAAKVPDPLSNTVQDNAAPANAAYVDVQKLLVLMKTDMPSALGVLITYEDNDGD